MLNMSLNLFPGYQSERLIACLKIIGYQVDDKNYPLEDEN